MGQLQATSNKVTLRSVDIDIDFIIRNTSVSESVQYEICDLGKFTYDFAVTTDVDNIDKIGIRAGAITISFFDNVEATSYKSIYDAYFDTTDPQTELTTNINIYNPSGAGSADVIKCRFNNQDISYDINQRKTTINFQPLRPSDVTSVSIDSLITNTSKNVYTNTSVSATLKSIVVRDFIDDALDDMLGSSGSNTVVTNFSATNPAQNSDVFFVFNEKQDLESGTLNVFEQLANISGVEGSVYGNMLGKKVYFARNITGGQTVTMNESDFKSLKLENPKKNKYSQLRVIHGNLPAESTSSVINPDADKTANFSFRKGNLDKRVVLAASPTFTFGASSTFNTAAAVFGVASYEKVLLDTQIPTLSGTFFGANKVLPHQCMVISFANDNIGGSRLIKPIDGTYRFSKLTYDLINDTVDFNAYKIA
jgi:hypothetical protein